MVNYVPREEARVMIDEAIAQAFARFEPVIPVKSITKLPTARKGSIIFVPDAVAGPSIAIGDGVNWQQFLSVGVLT